MHHFRSFACSLLVLATACTPITLNKLANGGACVINAECSSGICVKNKCVGSINCSDAGNDVLDQCQNIACKADADCPANYYCGGKTCVFGDKPPCKADADCASQGKKCLIDGMNPAQNRCVLCKADTDCKPGVETCDNTTYTCKPKGKDCHSNAQCSSPTPACNTSTHVCVQCVSARDCPNPSQSTCTQNTCRSVDMTCMADTDCTDPSKPACDPAAMTCAGCDAVTTFSCPTGQTCSTTGTTKGQCVLDATGCTSNADCTAGAPTGSTKWCDESATPHACKPCTDNSNCPGGTCAGGFCSPQQNTNCSETNDNNDCSGASDACVSGQCQATCTGLHQCKAGHVCDPTATTNRTCVAEQGCSTNPDCGSPGPYNGLACTGGKCVPCTLPTDCVGSPNNRTTCDVSRGVCVVAPSTLLPLGAECTSNPSCDSGLCLTLSKGAGIYGSFCSSICSRTASTASQDFNDCPLAADATANAHRMVLPPLASDRGFRCTALTEGAGVIDGARFCMHATDYTNYFGTALPTKAFQTAGGINGTAPADAHLCEADTLDPTASAGNMCALRCGSADDCDPAQTDGVAYSCSEHLTQEVRNGVKTGQIISNGTRTCLYHAPGVGTPPGTFCGQASDCDENMCDGQCINEYIARTDSMGNKISCASSSCSTAGDVCLSDQFCYYSTIRSIPATCDYDSDCNNGDKCYFNRCYAPQATTNQLCQDRHACSDQHTQRCAGRCAKHCNNSSDCSDLMQQNTHATICGYRPPAPALTGLDGTVWSRVCRAPFPYDPAAGAIAGDHTQARGKQCNHDTECQSEVCAGGICTELCGRASLCATPAFPNAKCQLVLRAVDPDDPGSITLLQPVCLDAQ